jgi:hypothetical protein
VSINQILRLQSSAGTLLIGHRAAFGRGRDLDVYLPQDEVRRQLHMRSADWSVLAALRRFWQPWQYDPLRTNVDVRDLIDRVASMTANGRLLAYMVCHHRVDRDRFAANARRAIEQMLPQLFETPITIGAQAVKRQVAISADLERLTQVVRRALDHLNPAYRDIYVNSLDKDTLTTFLSALTAWVDQREDAVGFVFDALLSGSGLVYVPSSKMLAAEFLYRCLEVVQKDTQATKNIEEASWWLGRAMSVHGPSELIHVVLRGTIPKPACNAKFLAESKAPPTTRRAPERYLAPSPPPPPPPVPKPYCHACMMEAAQKGAAFVTG